MSASDIPDESDLEKSFIVTGPEKAMFDAPAKKLAGSPVVIVAIRHWLSRQSHEQ